MKKFLKMKSGYRFLFNLAILALTAAGIFMFYQFRSEAVTIANNPNGQSEKIAGQKEGLENYDVRTDKTEAETLLSFRQTANRSAVEVADARDKFVAGEELLRQSVPTLKVEYNEDIRTPEVIAPDVTQGRAFLTAPSQIKKPNVLRNFVKQNNLLIGLTDEQANQLKLAANYTNPDGELSFVHYDQTINGVPVFRGEIKAGFTKTGEMIRVINNLAPELDYERLATDFRNPADAATAAARFINYELKSSDLSLNENQSTELKAVFGQGDFATTAEKMYFPTEPGVARAAWRVLIWQPVYSYYVIVDAETGKMLWRKCITEEQSQAATYNVYANTTSFLKVLDSPAPLTPGPIDPSLGTQGAVQPRVNVTFVGNEAPYTFNNNGWITDNANGANGWTDGNAVQAGVDRVAPSGVDAAVSGTNRVFNFNYNPAPGNPAPGDDPLGAEFQKGASTQMFYVMNRYHDEMYLLGYTEAARNFQQDNFGRGGVGNDRVSAEGQDSSGTNNANFATPADGGRGVMQMYLWTAPTPDYDGTIDADVIIHEVTHGTSNRLHGNAAGLSSNMSRGMGEGWGDFYGHAMLSEPTDPIQGIYTTGGYATYGGAANPRNYYYGIRRFPKAVKSFVGPNGKPHNPLSFRHLNANCNTEIGTPTAIGTISAFPRGTYGSTQCDQVHGAGEIWSSALWEVRAKLVTTHGWATGNRRVLQYVTDGMKLAPLGPTFLQERDAIIAAAQASNGGVDVADIWAGFAIRGMGFSAVINSPSPANVTEAFDLPNIVQSPTFSFSDAGGNNNRFADPGETLQLNIPLTNNTGNPATGVTLQVVGGGAADYGTIANGQTVSRAVSFTVPAGTVCGSVLTITFNINSNIGPKTETRSILIGQPAGGFSQAFDTVTAPNLPAGWTAPAPNPSTGSTIPWRSQATGAFSAPNAMFAPDPTNVYLAQLESPPFAITHASAKLKFKINYNTELDWDGTTLDMKIGAGAYQDIIAAGGTFVTGAYPNTISAGTFPNAGRQAWSGNSNGYRDVEITLPAAANGQNVQFRWNMGADTAIGGVGTFIDNVEVVTVFNCSLPVSKARADFDGDGKTDLSVFRPSEGNWYLLRSTAGFAAQNWGASTDILVPGDYDGDGKTDVAVARRQFPGLTFYILNSSNSTVTTVQWGATNDVPQVGDYDGDGKADIAVFRFSDGTWYVRLNTGGTYAVQFGGGFDVPVANDYDGDGKTDLAVFRSGTWYILRSSLGFTGIQFGLANDKLVPADYDGDGKTDLAVYRASEGTWYIQRSQLGFTGIQFGLSNDVLVPGDYDGDGKTDVAVYRVGVWYVNRSTAGFLAAAFGVNSDMPIPAQYVP